MPPDSPAAAPPPFVHLHAHSYYSFLDSMLSPAEMVQLALEQGAAAVAVTDTNCLSGAVAFYKAALEAGIKPIIGAEIRQPLSVDREMLRARAAIVPPRLSQVPFPEARELLSEERCAEIDAVVAACAGTAGGKAGVGGDCNAGDAALLSKSMVMGRMPMPPLNAGAGAESASPALCPGDVNLRAVLLARNFEGYSEISRVCTERMLHADFDLFRELRALSSNVFILTDCVEVLGEGERRKAKGEKEGFGIQDSGFGKEGEGLKAKGEKEIPDSGFRREEEGESIERARVYGLLRPSRLARKRNRAVYECAQGLGIPLVVACDAKMAHAKDAPLHHMLQAMRRLTTIYQLPEEEHIDPAQHMMSPAEVWRFFGIAPECPHQDKMSDTLAPLHEALRGAVLNTVRIAEECNCELPLGEWKFLRFENLPDRPDRLLREIVLRGVRERYGNPPSQAALDRMNYELQIIEKLQFTEYFLLVNRIVEEAHSRGFFTIGRGSAANSIVSYALRLTNVCPLRYNLYFERFLNPERNSPPDIDIDFSWKERDDIIQWCFDYFGRDKVALIATIQTLQARQAIREVAKAHGIGESEVNAFNRLHETGFKMEEGDGGGRGKLHNLAEQEPWRTILQQAARITDFPRHLSIHCGGIIIAPRNVVDYVPLTRSAKGFVITQMDMYSIEDLGLIKIDLLSNRSLGVLKDALAAGEKNPFGVAAGMVDSSGRLIDGEDTAERETQVQLGPRPGLNANLGVAQIFQREAVRMKVAGTRRGTSVALAGVLGVISGGQKQEGGDGSRGLELIAASSGDGEDGSLPAPEGGRRVGAAEGATSKIMGAAEGASSVIGDDVICKKTVTQLTAAPMVMGKIPMLPHSAPSVHTVHKIHKVRRDPCLSLLKRRVFDFEYVTSDPATRHLIDQGATMGCFYIESPGMRALFERLRCKNFEEVVVASSIIRPGVAESGMMQEYIARHQTTNAQMLARETSRAGLSGSRSGARVALSLQMATEDAQVSEMRNEAIVDDRSPTTLLPPSPASERMAKGTMPINAHAKSRNIYDYVGGAPPHPDGSSIAKRGKGKDGQECPPYSQATREAKQPPPPHPILMQMLPETHGVMVYQEDVLKVAHELAGMTLGEADLLRRAMSGKMRSRDAMEAIQNKFIQGAIARGIPEADVMEIWRQVSSFAGYSFCKGHSAAFAVVSYQIAYLKAHYPAEFFAGVLSNGGGFYGAGAYLMEARRWGIEVLLPDVNASEVEYTGRTFPQRVLCVDAQDDGEPLQSWVRIGLGAIKGLNEATAKRIVNERTRRGRFASLHDFIKRTRIGHEECRLLIRAGAMDRLAPHTSPQIERPRMLLECDYHFRHREMNSDLLGSNEPGQSPLHACTPTPLSPGDICRIESEVLGYMVSSHPIDFAQVPDDVIPATDIRLYRDKRVRMAGWMISAKLISTKTTGQAMKMLTLEDKTSTFETVLFPRVYARYAARTLTSGPYLVRGKVDMTLGSPTLNVEHIEVLAMRL